VAKKNRIFAATDYNCNSFNTSLQSFHRYLPYTKFMCYAPQPVTRKVFDYNAYIQGRLRGEYVVIYHTVVEEPEEINADIHVDIAVVPVPDTKPDIQDRVAISNALPESKTLPSLIWKSTISCSVTIVYYYYDALHLIPFNKTTSANCRGAPQKLYNGFNFFRG